MSILKISCRALVVVGFVGLAAATSTRQASAFSGHTGGGFGGGHMGGGHMSGGGFGQNGGNRFGGFGGRSMGGINFRPGVSHVARIDGRRPGRIECFRAPCNIGGGGNHFPGWNCHWTHSCGPRPVSCRYYTWSRFCGWRPPVFIPRPPVIVTPTPIAYPQGAYTATAPNSAAPLPAYAPAQPAACVSGGTYITIVFQPTVTVADITAFLTNFNVTMADGPNKDGVYRIKISTGSVDPSQYAPLIESMRSQTNIVSQISG